MSILLYYYLSGIYMSTNHLITAQIMTHKAYIANAAAYRKIYKKYSLVWKFIDIFSKQKYSYTDLF